MKLLNVLICALLTIGQLVAQEDKNEPVTICWDTSLSMANRDIDKDFTVLNDLFKNSTEVKVQVLYFDVAVEEKQWVIKNGNWTDLKEELQKVTYDGASVYANLKGKLKNSRVLVFTDGNRLLRNDQLALPDKSLVVNSSINGDVSYLERLALINRGRLMNVAPKSSHRDSKEKNVLEESRGLLKGTVYIDNNPAADTRVAVKGVSDSFLTNETGEFAIKAEVGDTLLITSKVNKTFKMVPVEMMAHVNVFLVSNIVSLDEVIVVEKKLQEQELVNNGYGIKSKERIGYAVATIEEDEISELAFTADNAVANKISGVDVARKGYEGIEGGLSQTIIRGQNSYYMNPHALIVIDGIPVKRSSSNRASDSNSYSNTIANSSFIDPSNIKKITVLKGLAATNVWGTDGSNGVILITSKTGSASEGPKKIIDQARLKNNIYGEKNGLTSARKTGILKALEISKSTDDAYLTYLKMRDANRKNVTFYLDAFGYFKSKKPKIASRIISNLWEENPENVEILKLTAMAFSVVEDYQNALRINEEIILLEPSNVNAHLNKAISLRSNDKSQDALKELVAMKEGNTNYSLDASKIYKTLDREIKNVVFENKGKINSANLNPNYLNNVKYKVRLVFEWNLRGAEFELQFVNPQKRFFDWKHTNSEDQDRLKNEIDKNYMIEEFEFNGGDVAGEWIINVKSLENYTKNTTTPLVVKTTIYQDFGQLSQKKQEVLSYLSDNGDKKNIIKLQVQ